MAVLLTLVGMGLVATALIDLFQTLFHPAGRGALSDWTARFSWRIFRTIARKRASVLTYAGPTAILLIIISWAALTWFGFALIYLPRLSTGFDFEPVHGGSLHQGIGEAVSLSLGALITLTEGGHAKLHWVELLRGLEAVIGFAILTASVSWLLSIYPVLETRRALAQAANLLHRAERENRLDVIQDAPDKAQDWIFELGQELAVLRNQMAQFPITYYFGMNDPESALAGALSYLLELGNRASAASTPGLKISGTVLGGAVETFLEMLANDFLNVSREDKQAILRAYAQEQMTDLIFLQSTIPYPRKKVS